MTLLDKFLNLVGSTIVLLFAAEVFRMLFMYKTPSFIHMLNILAIILGSMIAAVFFWKETPWSENGT